MNVLPFHTKVKEQNLDLTRRALEILQVNFGKLCNQACHHCHVEASPKRTEIMQGATAERLMDLIHSAKNIHTVDLTGGAPELNANFRGLVSHVRSLGKIVLDRCNLTVFFEKGQENTAEFLAQNSVKVVASLPCYSKANVDKQRGRGVFDKSIRALQKLNQLGYAKKGSSLELDLVYNPVGAFLPPEQEKLEEDYKKELWELFGIEFNRLYTITNMPIKRFLDDLIRSGSYEHYMGILANSFNPKAALGIMCRNVVSVGWDGKVYDCDFNQMLEIPLSGKQRTIWDIQSLDEITGEIAFGDHCYGCTAGNGSSCGGVTV